MTCLQTVSQRASARALSLWAIVVAVLLCASSAHAFQTGDNDRDGPAGECKPLCSCVGENPVKPYSGNAHRVIVDLSWMTTGNIPFNWVRTGNSREQDRDRAYGTGHNWRGPFQWTIYNAAKSASGRPVLAIVFPDGSENRFTENAAKPAQWDPEPGVGHKLTRSGAVFNLVTPDGQQYHFVKLGPSAYRMVDFRDEYQNVYTLSYNAAGKLIKVTEPAGRYFTIDYKTVAGIKVISAVHTSDGRGVTYDYDTLGTEVVLANAMYGDGTQAAYDYVQLTTGGHPLLSKAVDPRVVGAATSIKYEYADLSYAVGFIAMERNGVTNDVMMSLVTSGDKREARYANAGVQRFIMPESQTGSVSAFMDAEGRTTTYAYGDGGKGFLAQAQDSLGRLTKFTRSSYGNLIERVNADNTSRKWTRDDLDLVISQTDELGRVTTFTRDDNHRVTRIDYPDSSYETFSYNLLGQVLDHRFRNGGIERNIYDGPRGLKTSYIDAEDYTTEYEYDTNDRVSRVIDARGNSTSFLYNERGLLTRLKHDADGSYITYHYDNFGNRIRVVDELGHAVDYEVDEFRRVKSVTDHPTPSTSRTTHYAYDLPGSVSGATHAQAKPTLITLPSGKKTAIVYNDEWQKIEETVGYGSADAATTKYKYNRVGDLVTVTDPLGRQWIKTYDKRHRIKTSADPLGHVTQWTYDKVGNRKKEIRADGTTTRFDYDQMNRLVKTTDALGRVTRMVYDNGDNVTRVTDPRGKHYDATYDLLHRKLTATYPDTSVEYFTWDEVGNLHTYTTRAGQVMTCTYDDRNRQTLCDWNDSTPDVSREYDDASRLLTLANGVSKLTYSYDDANQRLSETQNIDGSAGAKSVTYDYNLDALLAKLTYPSGLVVNYGYTARNQIDTIIAAISGPAVNYDYDASGNRARKTLNNGTTTDYGYDDDYRMTSVDHRNGSGNFAAFDYGYDDVNRRTYVKRDGGLGDVFGYDDTDQLTQVQYDAVNPEASPSSPLRSVDYMYDASGNRKVVEDDGAAVPYRINSLNQYTRVGGATLGYDANGNLRSKQGWTYGYDALNRLTTASKTGATYGCAYDARNRCVKRTINGVTTFLYYDGWNLLEERNAAGALLASYVHGAVVDELLAAKIVATGAGWVYYHHDASRNVTQLTAASGDVVEKYAYDVFGKATIRDSSGTELTASAYGNRFMFTGREFIAELNLYDYRNRMYSPEQGRFLQTDPIGFAAGDVNLYRYVRNNPVNKADAFGLWEYPDPEWILDCQDACDKVCCLPRELELCYSNCNEGKPPKAAKSPASSPSPGSAPVTPPANTTGFVGDIGNVNVWHQVSINIPPGPPPAMAPPVTPSPAYPGDDLNLEDGTSLIDMNRNNNTGSGASAPPWFSRFLEWLNRLF